jgi:NAD(P)-dependent dehydrogenase (short-subunit alcohol dehydrogenase family)
MPDQQTLPAQRQSQQPGEQGQMNPQPETAERAYRGVAKLQGKAALITGGDSGIGRAVAVYFAKEGADVAIVYVREDKDAEETRRLVENEGCRCLLISGDVTDEAFCQRSVEQTVRKLGRLDVLVNNAGEQHPQETIEQISAEQLERTFRTNIFAMFFMTKAALKYLKKGAAIINTASVTAYRGSPSLLDYSSTKGAIVSFTRSLSVNLAKQGIRVNAVAPGPIWTPLIPATFPPERVKTFGADTPMGRPGQPEEVAPSYVFLASDDSSYMSGQVLHPNGGEIIES